MTQLNISGKLYDEESYRAGYEEGKEYAEGQVIKLYNRIKKEGMEEVVEWENNTGWYGTSCAKRCFCIPEGNRQSKLKEWGIAD